MPLPLGAIILFGWPGSTDQPNGFQITENAQHNRELAYSTIEWFPGNPDPLPSLAEILAQESAAEAYYAARDAAEERKHRRLAALTDEDTEALLTVVDILCDGLWEVGSKLKSNALTSALDPTIINRLQNLRQKVQAAKQVT